MLVHLGKLSAAISLGILAAACSTTPHKPETDISQIVAIGDSNLDIGRVFSERAGNGNDGRLPPPNTVDLRSSNSTILPEFLSDRLGIPQLNYAWGGATSGKGNIVAVRGLPDVANTGALAQMDEFIEDLDGRPADPDALYIVFAGSNDLALIDKNDQVAVDKAVDGAIVNLSSVVHMLALQGAQKIVIATRTPRPVLSNADRPENETNEEARNDAAGRQMNILIRDLVTKLDAELAADVALFDAYAVIRDIADNAEAYGFEPYSSAPENFCTVRTDACDVLVNYDAAHKTSAVHSIMADKFIAQFELRPLN